MGQAESKHNYSKRKLQHQTSVSLPDISNFEENQPAKNKKAAASQWDLTGDLTPLNSPSNAVGISGKKRISSKVKRVYVSSKDLASLTDGNVQLTKLKQNIQPTWKGKLPVCGQGVVVFEMVRNTPFSIVVKKPLCDDWISLNIDHDGSSFTKKHNGVLKTLHSVENKTAGFQKDTAVSYWLSYNRDNLSLKYGKGYVMEEAILMEYCFLNDHVHDKSEEKKVRQAMYNFFNPEEERIVELYDIDMPAEFHEIYKKVLSYQAHNSGINGQSGQFNNTTAAILSVTNKVHFNKNPLLGNRPCYILDSSKVNLVQLDKGNHIFSSSLPSAVKELFENVKGCELDYKNSGDDHESINLCDTIRHSIITNGCLLNNKLKEKATGFGKNPNLKKTYLRITLGKGFGKSPGIPYVLEIWPSRHYSPVHNHGNASAVIKVLFGSIHVRIFNKFTKNVDGKEDEPACLKEFDAVKGDVTWMDRNWYQTHQLENLTDDFCATLQCYNYDDWDKSHWPYFNYLNDSSAIAEFIPNTDFTFLEMCEKIQEEYKISRKKF